MNYFDFPEVPETPAADNSPTDITPEREAGLSRLLAAVLGVPSPTDAPAALQRLNYREERVEHYRARGEDYSDAYTWADQDVITKFGPLNG